MIPDDDNDSDADTTQAIQIPDFLQPGDKPLPPTLRVYLERIERGSTRLRLAVQR